MKKKKEPNTIAINKQARREYSIIESIEAGLELEGWEVKSLRAGSANIAESYVMFRDGEAYLVGALFTPSRATCSHHDANPLRERKLLLNGREIIRLKSKVDRDGHTIVPTRLYWSKSWAKIEIALGKGKNLYDKRHAIKARESKIEMGRQQKRR